MSGARSGFGRRALAGLVLVVAAAACATLQRVNALRQVEFALAGVRNARLAGVDISRVSTYRDLSPADVGRLTIALTRREVPLVFELDVRAHNPPDNGTAATMSRLAWTLLLNDRETISGVLDSAVTMPPGQDVIIPIPMRVDLQQFFDGPAQGLVDLAASLAGLRADPTRIALRATPTISTPFGAITYPGSITIVNRTVGGQ